MKRNFKALGLAMVAAFALSAVAASGAQAVESHHLTVKEAPAIITAHDDVKPLFKITAGEHEIKCETSLYEGTVTEKTNPEVTVTPTYKECKIDGTIAAEVDVNHCAFILTGETDISGHAGVHLECTEGSEITITYSIFTSKCIIHIPAQTPEKGVHYTQTKNPKTEKQDITVEVTATGIHYTETKNGGFFCPEDHTGTDGTFEGALTAEGYKDTCGSGLSGTEKTTPGSHYNLCEGEVQDLELTTT